MIQSFKCSESQKLFEGKPALRFGSIRDVAERKLLMLHRATRIDDLRIPPNNRLEKLKGDRVGFYSIRINDQWRLCFQFENGNAFEVEIVDYH
jgi:proteic killer suppression protein